MKSHLCLSVCLSVGCLPGCEAYPGGELQHGAVHGGPGHRHDTQGIRTNLGGKIALQPAAQNKVALK